MQPVEDLLLVRIRAILLTPIEGWEIQKTDETQHVAVYKRDNPDKKIPFAQWLAIVELPISAKEASVLIHEAANRRKWDKMLVDFEDLGQDLVYFSTVPVMGGLISGRDFVIRRLFQTMNDKTEICAVESVEDERYPKKSGLVRAWNHSNGVAIIPRGANGCTVRMLGCLDARGWLPEAVVAGGMSSTLISILHLLLKEAKIIAAKPHQNNSRS